MGHSVTKTWKTEMKRGGFREECRGAEGVVGKEPDSPLSRGLGLTPVGYWILGDRNLVKMFCYPNFELLLGKTTVKDGLGREWPIAVCLGLSLLLYWKSQVSGNPSVVGHPRVLWFDAGLVVRDLAGSGAPLDAGLLARADQRRSNGSKLEKCGSHMRFSFLPFYFGFQDRLVQRRRTKLLLLRFHTALSYQGASRSAFRFRGQRYRN